MRSEQYRKRFYASIVIGIILFIVIASVPKPAYSYRISEYKPLSTYAGLDPRPLNIEISPDGSYVYFTEQYTGRIGAMRVTGDQRQFIEYILPFKPELYYSEPYDLDVVSDSGSDYIFYTDYHQNQIGRLSTDIRTFDLPTPGSGPRGIFAVSKTLVWFTEFFTDKIGKLSYYGGNWVIEEYSLPSNSKPVDIVVSRDAVYFTEFGRNRIGMINTTTNTLYEYSIAAGSPWGITMDPDGMVWFTASGGVGYIGQLNPWSKQIIEHWGLPSSYSQPRYIAVDNYTRDVWFTEFTGHKVGLYRPGENIFYEFPTLTPSPSPSGIVVSRTPSTNGTLNVYFTEWSGNKIGHLYYGSSPAQIDTYGTTSTVVATKVTSAATGTRIAAVSTSSATSLTYHEGYYTTGVIADSYTASGFDGTTTVKSDTAYRLSTSTMGTSTSYITEVAHTSTTSTSTSYKYISTESLTSTNTSFSTSISYIDTSSYTTTTTVYNTIYVQTHSLTSTSMVSRPGTLTSTITHTSYKSTTSATTTSTTTITAPEVVTETVTSTIGTLPTTPTTLTTLNTTFTYSPTFVLPFNFSCLIATAAYGSEVSPAVQYLRGFRDNLVMSTFAGSNFMDVFNKWYYSFSPYVADSLKVSPTARTLVKAGLYPLFGVLKLSAATFHTASWINPEFAIVLAGMMASGLIGIIYNTPLIFIALKIAKRRRRFTFRYKWLHIPLTLFSASILGVLTAELTGSTWIMMASTASLVLSTMLGCGLAAAVWLSERVKIR